MHNTDGGLRALADYFAAQKPDFAAEMLEKEKLWAVLYGAKPLNEGVLRVKIRQLTARIEEFLAWNAYRESPEVAGRMLLRAQRSHLSYSDFAAAARKMLAKTDRDETRGIDYHTTRLSTLNELVSHPEYDGYREDGSHYAALNADLDAYYVLRKYQLLFAQRNWQRIRGEAAPSPHPVLAVLAGSETVVGNPAIELYRRLFRVYEHPEDRESLNQLHASFTLVSNRGR